MTNYEQNLMDDLLMLGDKRTPEQNNRLRQLLDLIDSTIKGLRTS